MTEFVRTQRLSRTQKFWRAILWLCTVLLLIFYDRFYLFFTGVLVSVLLLAVYRYYQEYRSMFVKISISEEKIILHQRSSMLTCLTSELEVGFPNGLCFFINKQKHILIAAIKLKDWKDGGKIEELLARYTMEYKEGEEKLGFFDSVGKIAAGRVQL